MITFSGSLFFIEEITIRSDAAPINAKRVNKKLFWQLDIAFYDSGSLPCFYVRLSWNNEAGRLINPGINIAKQIHLLQVH